MGENTSLISVLCAVRDESLFIIDAIRSVQNQDYTNIELICVDDFSTDNTAKLIQEIAVLDNRIKFFSNEKPGKNNAYNIAFKHSKGEYIIFFAGDDLMPRNSITSRLNSILINQDIDIASGRVRSFGSGYKSVIYPRIDGYNPSGGCIIMKRSMAEDVFPIPAELPNEDSWIDIHTRYLNKMVSFTSDIVLFYRLHTNNSSNLRQSFSIANGMINARKKSLNLFLASRRGLLDESDIQSIEKK